MLGGPQEALGAEAENMWWKMPILAAAMTGVMSRWAAKTPPEERFGFTSYRAANLMLAIITAVTISAYFTM